MKPLTVPLHLTGDANYPFAHRVHATYTTHSWVTVTVSLSCQRDRTENPENWWSTLLGVSVRVLSEKTILWPGNWVAKTLPWARMAPSSRDGMKSRKRKLVCAYASSNFSWPDAYFAVVIVHGYQTLMLKDPSAFEHEFTPMALQSFQAISLDWGCTVHPSCSEKPSFLDYSFAHLSSL
jgi:hypothetical protein